MLRTYDAENDVFKTVANWKTNSDMKLSMYDVAYTDKAGAGNFGTNGRWSLKRGAGVALKIDGNFDSYIELLVQDDLTGLVAFNINAQGSIEDR